MFNLEPMQIVAVAFTVVATVCTTVLTMVGFMIARSVKSVDTNIAKLSTKVDANEAKLSSKIDALAQQDSTQNTYTLVQLTDLRARVTALEYLVRGPVPPDVHAPAVAR